MKPRTGGWWTLVVFLYSSSAFSQSAGKPPLSETYYYAIDVAGIRVGTMTATRQKQADGLAVFTLISDVSVNFLIYKLRIYYKVTNRVRDGNLLLSTVEARTNKGDFSSRTEWKTDHYAIVADQYKHHLTATEPYPIQYTVTNLFFSEPVGRNTAFAEYFGDYFALSATSPGHYNARRDANTDSRRTDEYIYEKGRLVKIIKKNPFKNFVIRLLD